MQALCTKPHKTEINISAGAASKRPWFYLPGRRSSGRLPIVGNRESLLRCLLLALSGPEVAGRACLLCPGISDINLLGYGECIVNLDPEIANRALNLRVA